MSNDMNSCLILHVIGVNEPWTLRIRNANRDFVSWYQRI